MPWGALTGIRPTKMAYMEKHAGRDYHALFEKMRVSEENVRLVDEILSAQEGIYSTAEGADLFVSIPFCPTKCAYCSFITAPIEKLRHFLDPYLACLEKELAAKKPIRAISAGNLPLQGINTFVRMAISRSRGESIILHPVIPAALQPSPIAIVRDCFPLASALLKKRSRLNAALGR